ncbi:MAG: bifunctional alpha/beta hydrolase/OsmC family protein [Paracoccaceae bacterium]|nr:bifunctional alpha/beta hydrolase/OsmC family protein [Paracoccaceae bacterium]
MKTQKVEFQGHAGMLAARLDYPEGPIRGTDLFAHCFTCSKDIPAARRIAGRLAAEGLAVLRFDFTGLGHSQGEFSNTNFSTNVQDLELAAKYLEEKIASPQLLVGHSLGGAAVLRAAGSIPSARAVATIGAPFDPGHVTNNFAGQLESIRIDGEAKVDLAGRSFNISKQFLDDIEGQQMKDAIRDLRKALLIMHSPSDDTVSIDNAADIFTAAKHPKSFVTLDDADHLITRAKDAEYVAETIQAWSGRYLDLAPQPLTDAAPDGVVRVSEADSTGFLQDVDVAGRHLLLADEPASVGGSNLGPTPYQFVSSGLGACTTMTLRLYARRKKIPLEHVSVEISHDKRHIDALDDSIAQKVDVFRREIRLYGPLSDEDRQSLLEIADKCPVHRTLHSSSEIETVLMPSAV